jgi:hypothetical protein
MCGACGDVAIETLLLRTGRSRVRVLMVLLEFSSDIKLKSLDAYVTLTNMTIFEPMCLSGHSVH